MLDARSDFNGKTPSCYPEIINELIWNNQFLCYDKINLGFVKIGDLITSNNSFSYGINLVVNPEQRFFLMSIINSILAEWRSVLKATTDVPQNPKLHCLYECKLNRIGLLETPSCTFCQELGCGIRRAFTFLP